MQNRENKLHLSHVWLLCSALLEWEERIRLLASLFQISGEVPTNTTIEALSPLGYIFRMVHKGTIIYEQ